MTEDDAAAACRADAMAGAMAGAMQYGFTAYESTMTVRTLEHGGARAVRSICARTRSCAWLCCTRGAGFCVMAVRVIGRRGVWR